jgi:hypothetical protein
MSEEDFDPEEVEAHRRATAEREEVWTTRDAERMAVRANMVGEARTIGCRVETVTLFDGDGRLLMMLNRPTWTRMTPRCQLDRRLAENITSSNHSGRRRTTVTRRSRRMATSAQQQKQWSDGVGPRLNALPNILDYTCYSNNLDRTARKASHTPDNLRVHVTSRSGRPHRSHSFGHFFMMSFVLQMHFKVLHRFARSNCIDLARTATTTDKLSLPFGPVRNMSSGSTHHATHLILHADASSAPGCRPLYSNSYFSPGCVLCMWSKSDCNHAGGSCGKQVPVGQRSRNGPSRNDRQQVRPNSRVAKKPPSAWAGSEWEPADPRPSDSRSSAHPRRCCRVQPCLHAAASSWARQVEPTEEPKTCLNPVRQRLGTAREIPCASCLRTAEVICHFAQQRH